MNFSFDTLSERERRMVTFGGIAAVVLLVVGVIMPLNQSVTRAQERVQKKQADLVWMQSVGPELAAAGPSVARPATQESLLVVVDRSAREVGLGSALTSSEPSGNGGLRVRLEKAPFAAVVGWLGRLSEQHGIRVESATMDTTGEPGVVNAGLVLRTQ
ncbi:MAG: type II secretion system protein M [Steroidobacteraceae bacterium]|nr:type II secretion system protein M [Steroidobacteraceae bacterium]